MNYYQQPDQLLSSGITTNPTSCSHFVDGFKLGLSIPYYYNASTGSIRPV